jgi:uncharacterized protein
MRILHVTDFHFQKKHFHWLIEGAPRAEVVCVSGDFLDLGSKTPIFRQVEWVQRWLCEFPRTLVYCSGNHDYLPNLGMPGGAGETRWLERIQNPNVFGDGSSVCVGGTSFATRGWMDLPPRISAANTVILSHEGPAESSVATDQYGEWGEYGLLDELSNSKGQHFVLCGHVHEPNSWYSRVGQSWAFNPGVDSRGERPNFVLLDLERRTATRIAQGEQETVWLDRGS